MYLMIWGHTLVMFWVTSKNLLFKFMKWIEHKLNKDFLKKKNSYLTNFQSFAMFLVLSNFKKSSKVAKMKKILVQIASITP